jgi:hypothetical protein
LPYLRNRVYGAAEGALKSLEHVVKVVEVEAARVVAEVAEVAKTQPEHVGVAAECNHQPRTGTVELEGAAGTSRLRFGLVLESARGAVAEFTGHDRSGVRLR